VDEIEPTDRWGTAHASVAVDVDLVVREGKRLVNDLNDLPHKLGRHKTTIKYLDVV